MSGERKVAILTTGVRAAVQYVLNVGMERLFSFRLEEEDLRLISHAAEDYLMWHTDHKFATLEFYHQVAV